VVADASREISAFICKGKSDQAIQRFFLDCFIIEDEGIASRGEPLTQSHSVTSLKTCIHTLL
jgi:hypothetical protein